jgi:hypothetical protein
MASTEVEELIKQAQALRREEQFYLIGRLAETIRLSYQPSSVRRHWRELQGAVGFPALGEDAQDWVSRTRREEEEDGRIVKGA